jgi:hypothetical protein
MRFDNKTESRNYPSSRSLPKNVVVGLLFVILAFRPGFVSAEETQDEASEEAVALYGKGIALFENERYAEAAKVFEEIKRISPSFRVYLNIGQCAFKQRQYDLTLEAFTEYLKRGGENIAEVRREYVEAVITEVTHEVGQLIFEEEESLEIWVDDKLRASTPREEPLFVMPGERSVTLKKDGEVVFEETYVAEAEETIIVKRPSSPPPPPPVEETSQADEEVLPAPETTEAEEAPPAPEMTEPQEVPPALRAAPETTLLQAKRSPLKPVGFALIGVGGAALVSGIVTGAKYVLENNSLEEKCSDKDSCSDEYEDLHQRTRRLAIATNVLLPLGGVLAATGIVLTVAGHKIENKNEQLSFTPYVGDGATGITVFGRF